jgi:hypothetical protein
MPNDSDRPRCRDRDDDDYDDRPRRRREDDYDDFDDDRPRRRRDEDDDDYDDRPRRRRAAPSAGNGMAVAALILGLLSFCTGPLTGIPAGICGLVALGKTTGRGLAIAGLVLGLFGTIAGSVGAYFAYTRVESAKGRMREQNNLKQIGLAFHNQHDANGSFQGPYAHNVRGKPNTGLSWRVGLLPYIEQGRLYQRFDLDQAWDGPKNKSLSNTPIKTYTSPFDDMPGGSTETPYRTFYGGGAIFDEDGRRMTIVSVTDGTSNTIFAVQAFEQVPWAAPRDFKYDPNGPLPKFGHPEMRGVFHVLMVDGSVRVMRDTVSDRTLRAMITRNGGEVVEHDW